MNDEPSKKKEWIAKHYTPLRYTLNTDGLTFMYPDPELEALEHMWALPSKGGN